MDSPSQQSNERTSTIPELQINNHQERLQPTEESVNLNLRMHHNSTDENQIRDFEDEMGPNMPMTEVTKGSSKTSVKYLEED